MLSETKEKIKNCDSDKSITLFILAAFAYIAFSILVIVNTDNHQKDLYVLFTSITVGLLILFLLRFYAEKQSSVESRLKTAIKNKTLHMAYQPIFSIQSGKITAIESLIRWNDSMNGTVPPESIIDIAKKNGLYPELSYQIVFMAIGNMAPILENNKSISLIINVTEFEIQDVEYLETIENLVNLYFLSPEQITIELTEQISLPVSELAEFSRAAKAHGFNISLDDFGTGCANLNWLTEIEFDIIKVDKLFVHALANAKNSHLVLPIINMMSSLGKQVIFEGVEVKEQFEQVSSQDKNAFIQGWYFYEPMAKDALTQLIRYESNEQNLEPALS